MKIAFISYEYPPDAAYGGIATYARQAARMLHNRGHHIEIFTSSPFRSGMVTEDEGIIVHRVKETDYEHFASNIAPVFANRHVQVKFDVLEGPEYGADASEAVRCVPNIPLVVKLHTPTFLTVQGTYEGLPTMNPLRLRMFAEKAITYFSGLRRGNRRPWRYLLQYDMESERSYTLEADEIVAPSRDIGEILKHAWGLDSNKIHHIPYPYVPAKDLLDIPVETQTNIVTFLGRLEIRKGVVDLAKAIPLILHKHAHVKFRFIGSTEDAPKPKTTMRQYLEELLEPYIEAVEFMESVPLHCVPEILANTDICVFPSIWDNFPNVCLESMAAARGIVGSSAGGMRDMLGENEVGRIIPPRSPQKIAEAVIELLENPELRMALGRAARQRLLTEYDTDRIGTLQEASYHRAIERRQALGVRVTL